MNRRTSKNAALCGLLGALALAILSLGGLIPIATFCAPALSGIVILIAAAECGLRQGWLLYLAVALLSPLLVPERETAFVFVCFLGYYPLLKVWLERVRPRLLRGVLKMAVFNGGIGLAYVISSLSQAPVAISVPAIIIAVVFSTLIGIIFGIIPSVKAANLNPIDALRHE